jgi:hypothetical protein
VSRVNSVSIDVPYFPICSSSFLNGLLCFHVLGFTSNIVIYILLQGSDNVSLLTVNILNGDTHNLSLNIHLMDLRFFGARHS